MTSSKRPAPAAAAVFATELLAALIRRGVTDLVVCPGARSQALALAAAAAEEAGAVRLHVRLDERAAGFFAVGLARERGQVAPVIVTSGTAVANLVPAALEAAAGRVPFMALSADRPAALRGTRSNQTCEQAHIFGAAARLSLDVPPPANADSAQGAKYAPEQLAALALSAALGDSAGPQARAAGPVQLNLQFVPPLSGTSGYESMITAGFKAAAAERESLQNQPLANPLAATPPSAANVYTHSDTVPTVVVAGAGGDAAAEFASAAGLPLLAEAISGARGSPAALSHYVELCTQTPLGAQVKRAIVFGHPTLHSQLATWLARPEITVVVVDPHPATGHYAPGANTAVVQQAIVATAAEHDWLAAWQRADQQLLRAHSTRRQTAAATQAISRQQLVSAVWEATQTHERLVVAASRLVRELDSVATARQIVVHANRGLAGIDGTVATACGIAAAGNRTRLLIGDLALLHDAAALQLPPAQEATPNLQIIVGNDGGGSIFEQLPVHNSAPTAAFNRVLRTPQLSNFAALAAAYGWQYRAITTLAALQAELRAKTSAPTIIEVRLN